jgi:hypothetical protein
MYLPRIMIDQYGWPGFIAFAAPNVLGCAGFGYIVKNRVRSEAMVIRHRGAMTWFSAVTVAFHMFFIVYLLSEVTPLAGDVAWLPLLTAGIVWALGVVLSFLPNRDWLWLSAVVYAISLVTLFTIGFGVLDDIQWTGWNHSASLAWLTPTLCFGFLLCPYLDLTFHRAIQNSPNRHAFAIFGAAFLVMLVLTVCLWFTPFAARLLPTIGLIHILVQSVFTVGAHLREIRAWKAIGDDSRRWFVMALPLLGSMIMPVSWLFIERTDVGEGMYLRFLVFYGLLFPAYVLLFIWRWQARTVVRHGTLLLAGLLMVSLPLYELGFLHRRTWLLAIPLAVMLGWALLAARPREAKAVS